MRSTENTIEALRETTVSRLQVPPTSRDNRLICMQEVYWTKGCVNVLVLLVHNSVVRPTVPWGGFSKKTMEKQSHQRVKWWLLHPCFVIWCLTALWFVIEGTGVDSLLYTIHASKHGRKRRDVAFSNPSINQSGCFGSIFLALAAPPQWFPWWQKLFSHLATHCGCP